MALSNAQRQARWRERRDAREKARPEVVEGELVRRAEACLNYPHGTDNSVSDAERLVLADKIAAAAMDHLHRAQELAAIARRHRGMLL